VQYVRVLHELQERERDTYRQTFSQALIVAVQHDRQYRSGRDSAALGQFVSEERQRERSGDTHRAEREVAGRRFFVRLLVHYAGYDERRNYAGYYDKNR